jgi:hypothetical protein
MSRVTPENDDRDEVDDSELELTHNEPVIERARLADTWLRWRLCTCGWASSVLFPFWIPFYACASASY